MDDFGMLARDFGYRPQGKSAPMKSEASRPPSSSATAAEEDQIFSNVFGGPSKSTPAMTDLDYDAIFKNSASMNNDEAKSKATSLNLPVYDKPVYDDDIFDGLPGLKSKSMSSSSASPRFEENIFASMTTSPPKRSQQSDDFDDLMGNLSRTQKVEQTKHNRSKSPSGFDDLIPGFGSGIPLSNNRSSSEPTPKSTSNTKQTSKAMDNPFGDLESTSTTANSHYSFSTDPLEEIGNFKSEIPKNVKSSSVSGGLFDDIDSLNGFSNSTPAFTSDTNNKGKDHSPLKEASGIPRAQSPITKDSTQKASFRNSESRSPPVSDFQDSHPNMLNIPPVSRNHHTSFDQSTSPPSFMSPKTEHVHVADEIWLTVSEIPLFTQPTKAPPPSRPPPPPPRHNNLKPERSSLRSNSRKFANGFSSPNDTKDFQSPKTLSPEEMDSTLASAAMKEAMDRAEAKFRHAKEVREREREHLKASRSNKESIDREEEGGVEDDLRRNKLEREQKQREKEEEERKQRQLEREKARQAVERATREARERAAIEARERASVEARLKNERAAVQRAQAEARERAAVGAKDRAERAAAEAREKAAAKVEEESRRRAERAAVERVAAEARKRAAVEARERAAASRVNQQKNDDDFEAFFSSGNRPSSAPRPRASSSESASDPVSQNKRAEGSHRTSTTNMRKASSTTNIVDDLSSIFGAAPQFQEVEGETEERRRARLEREQRTQERAAKALAEKNQRDLQSQREQEERNRIGGTLDTEIKRWAAGKEGNLRALLSTLQYVLWPESGWQPVSLTDLITGANVKKAYRKATLCIHPDKVQQKGANLQQKYVAEKVFDILKEAWNKLNSEELF